VEDEGRLVVLERYSSREALELMRDAYVHGMVLDLIAALLDDAPAVGRLAKN
jgi:hypothetical protein